MNGLDERADAFLDALVDAPGGVASFRAAVAAFRAGETDEGLRLCRVMSVALWEGQRTAETYPVLTVTVAVAVGAIAFGPHSARAFGRVAS